MIITDEEMQQYYEGQYGRAKVERAMRIYDEILIPICGSYRTRGGKPNTMRQQFIQWFASGAEGREYRFGGTLGSGGKFWDIHRKPWHVTCYREDETRDRNAAIEYANIRLKALYEELK